MEPVVVKGRGRKRKRKGGEDVDKPARKTVLGMPCMVVVGRYVKKAFESGEFVGKIVSYDSGLYRVVYEDEDFEDLETHEVKELFVKDDEMNAAFRKRKKRLDEYILKKYAKTESVSVPVQVQVQSSDPDAKNEAVETVGNDNGVEVESGDLGGVQAEVDSESSSDVSDDEQFAVVAEVERPWVPPPQLPPSSGNFGVPDEDVAYLLSVYSFLRSFSVCLFLSPFGLDEFVGALNCSVHNTLMDAIHVALIRALKSHVETLSSEGSELASKCLRSMDWSLLDSLTWPMFIVQYLTTMRYTEGQEWKEFYVNVWEKDYYTLSAGRKLAILQLLCDDASNSAEIRTEIDNREESELGPDSDVLVDENIPRKGRASNKSLSKDQEAVKDEDEEDEDGNGDECRLCGMDGTLICCDGCPSSYHSRCIGLMKVAIPEGEWYCPECTVNRIGPIVTKTTSLKGAEYFGVDPYEQVFLGSCDHLLVMKASTNPGSHIQYYSSVDIPKVLQAFTCSPEYTAVYLDICKGILQYWEIPENIFSLPNSVGLDVKSDIANQQNVTINAENVNGVTEHDSKDAEKVNGVAEHDSKDAEIVNGVTEHDSKEAENVNGVSEHDSKDAENVNSVREHDSKDVVTEPASENENCDNKSIINSVCDLTTLPSEKKEAKLYMGLSFKPQAYSNVYVHGDYAASAGASLAILTSEEKPATQTQSSIISHRKLMSANYSLQAKAFSLAAKRFYWPNYEKRVGEVPRERCAWCLSCKSTGSSKRGCLLNAAASNAVKGAAKILSSMRQSKNVEGSLASIATYVMVMEESLYGLTAGPFLNSSYRNQWRKHVEEAATLGEIKAYLLELERNIRDIAFSTDWIKPVDDTGTESQLSQSAKSVVGSTQKRGPGRRGRKSTIITPEVPDADVNELSTDVAWWRGGMLSKHISQKGILPQMLLKHAARQGGREKINGVQYVDGLEVPKRSRQFIWRAAVDLSKTASQLALQVRYLDLHVRWNELVCPEQPAHEGKALEAEASAFRNACVFDKKVLGNKISYGVVFENQKHLPSRVLKKIVEVEETEDKSSLNWFLETHIPLYLIKEYESVSVADPKLPASDIKHVSKFSKLNKKQLKASGKNIYSFLEQKRDNMGKCSCTFCQHDVSFRIAARCSACQGYCHEQCAVGTNIITVARAEFLITCKRCYIEKEAARKKVIVGDSPTSPLVLQGQGSQHRSATVIKLRKPNGHERPLESSNSVSVKPPQKSKSGKKNSKSRLLQSAEQKPKNISNNNNSKAGSKKKNRLCLGLIWKKKNSNDTGTEFRINNLLLKGNPNGHLLAPKCQLCTQPYNSDLMYIKCEKCDSWFHADSVELEESKIMELFGYKCCRCRRIKIPVCPYADSETRLAKIKGYKNLDSENLESDSDLDDYSDLNDDQVNDWELDSTPVYDYDYDYDEAVNVQEENQFYSYPTVDQVNEDKVEVDFGPGPKKLPVRRHIKPDKESNGGFEIPPAYNPDPAAGESSTPIVEWDVSTNGVGDDMMFDYGDLNYEDMEFEPQTYFSFNELLANDEGVKEEDPQVTGPATDNCNPDQFQMGITYDQQEPMFSVESGLEMVPCRVCLQTDPCPDLFCQTCGLWLHQHCSPWDEDSSWEPETGWKCGNCREWC